MQKHRCQWCGEDPLYVRYHDEEWGLATYDDATLFEFLILEGAQAGLAWITVLKKREGYRAVFDQFDPNKIARFSDAKLAALKLDERIIRNRLKINSARQNARAFLSVQAEWGSFSQYLWHFVDGKPVINQVRSLADVPAKTPLSDQISKDLKARGFNFVGSTIVYAYLQAMGVVNDHTVDCFRYQECRRLSP
jgi:DNA-3-methyladenine glycosylase I